MLFTASDFLFVFLPVVLSGYYVAARVFGSHLPRLWLTLSSLFFYGYWGPRYLLLMLASILFNYLLGSRISRLAQDVSGQSTRLRQCRWLLFGGITLNVGVLGCFKYTDFLISIANTFIDTPVAPLDLLLPLGISFFTFTQIAYLVDCSKAGAKEYSLVNYTLFVTFFPHLIAGPIVHHKDLMPQFAQKENLHLNAKNLALGLFIFSLGLVKKVLIADNLGQWANMGYASTIPLSALDAWVTSLLYSFQLYFDFSGYSDMAIGLGVMFNIRLPQNFNSPYQARDIQDFWRRWHMTLSTWLRDYIYIPLGGKRATLPRLYFNLFFTFLVGGLWHGAGWTFLAWGALHGMAVVVHRQWREMGMRLPSWLGWGITFIFVNVAWVFFRAQDMATAIRMLTSMTGLGVVGLGRLDSAMLPPVAMLSVAAVATLAFLAPNSQQLSGLSVYNGRLQFREGVLAAGFVGFAFFYGVVAQIQNTPSDFLYFNF